jgi:putative transposase
MRGGDHRDDLGVEPICKVLPIAQSTFYAHAAILKNPDLASDRAKRDADLSPEVKRVWEQNNEVYGIRKVWHQMQREKLTIARCTVARLMKHQSIHGVARGKVKKTTVPDKSQPCPKDQVSRKFRAPAPNMLWVSDFTCVSTAAQQSLLAAMRGWQGFVSVAFIIDTFADKIVGWRVSSSPKTDFVLDALEQALHDRRPVHKGGRIHHSDRGGQYLSIRYSERLALAGIEPSVGSVGDS